LITGLTASGGDREQVTAAVLVYRALTWFLPILVGVICYLWWRRSRLASQPATAGSRWVTTAARCCPRFAGLLRTQRRPGVAPRSARPPPCDKEHSPPVPAGTVRHGRLA
jgi:hypothetical protein